MERFAFLISETKRCRDALTLKSVTMRVCRWHLLNLCSHIKTCYKNSSSSSSTTATDNNNEIHLLKWSCCCRSCRCYLALQHVFGGSATQFWASKWAKKSHCCKIMRLWPTNRSKSLLWYIKWSIGHRFYIDMKHWYTGWSIWMLCLLIAISFLLASLPLCVCIHSKSLISEKI